MDIGQLLNDLFFDYTLRTVALGTAVLGIVSGSLGSFALLRKQSLLGDAISHAALPGVVIAFLLTRSKTPGILLIGALIAGWLATLLITNVVRHTRIKEDSALGLALSLFFGLGLMLLSMTQNLPDARQAGLDRFLFGQAAALVQRDVIILTIVGLIALVAVAFFWKEFKLLSFDPEYAASLGLPVRWLDFTLTTLLVVAVVIGLQAVGVILMSAMVVAPAAAARQWTNRLGTMFLIAGAIGAVSGVGGTVLSSTRPGLATGPVIVLVASGIVLISLFLAPNRGLAWRWLRQQRNRRQLRLETVLSDLYRLEQQHQAHEKGHSIAVLRAMNAQRGGVAHTLQELSEQKLVREAKPEHWQLTEAGRQAAQQFLQNTQQSQTALATDMPEAEVTP
jgi:manganese/zinc/iron transport system permease protein